MASLSATPAALNLACTVANDFTLTLAVTENGSNWSATGATLATSIYDSAGNAVATNFTSSASDGLITLTLTDTQTSTLGVGVYSYRLSVTKSSNTRTWIAGTLSVVEPGVGGRSASASLTVTTSTVTLTLTSLVAPEAAQISVADTGGNFTGTNVETVLAEIDDKIDTHIADAADAHDASAISVLDSGGFYTGTDVEAVLAELAGLFDRPTAGQYFRATGNQTTGVTVASRMYFTPIDVGKSFTMDRIGCGITLGAASSVIRLGIYRSGANGFPDALLLDAGTVDSSTTGNKELTISQAVPAGRFWLAAVAQGGTPTCNVVTTATSGRMGFMQSFGSGVGPSGISGLIGTNFNIFYQSGVSGALPATATPGYDNSVASAVIVFGRAA